MGVQPRAPRPAPLAGVRTRSDAGSRGLGGGAARGRRLGPASAIALAGGGRGWGLRSCFRAAASSRSAGSAGGGTAPGTPETGPLQPGPSPPGAPPQALPQRRPAASAPPPAPPALHGPGRARRCGASPRSGQASGCARVPGGPGRGREGRPREGRGARESVSPLLPSPLPTARPAPPRPPPLLRSRRRGLDTASPQAHLCLFSGIPLRDTPAFSMVPVPTALGAWRCPTPACEACVMLRATRLPSGFPRGGPHLGSQVAFFSRSPCRPLMWDKPCTFLVGRPKSRGCAGEVTRVPSGPRPGTATLP